MKPGVTSPDPGGCDICGYSGALCECGGTPEELGIDPGELTEEAISGTPAEEVVDGEVVYAVVPYTGEAIALHDAPASKLAEALDDAREFERAWLSDFKRDVQDELIVRADAAVKSGEERSWTQRTDEGWKIEVDNPDRTDFQVDQVRATLERLIRDGEVTEAWLKLIVVPERWKVAKRELQRLIKLGGPAAEALKALEQPSTRPRSVRVERERAG